MELGYIYQAFRLALRFFTVVFCTSFEVLKNEDGRRMFAAACSRVLKTPSKRTHVEFGLGLFTSFLFSSPKAGILNLMLVDEASEYQKESPRRNMCRAALLFSTSAHIQSYLPRFQNSKISILCGIGTCGSFYRTQG